MYADVAGIAGEIRPKKSKYRRRTERKEKETAEAVRIETKKNFPSENSGD